jgi:hypothetical protein
VGLLKIMENLTFVYVCRPGENEELRYSIRSVLHHFSDAKIWVVGQKPDWYSGPFIQVSKYKSKHHAVYQNLKAISASINLPNNIVIMNDDFFIVDKIDKFNYYHSGKLLNKVLAYEKIFPNSSYTKRLRKGYNYLIKNNVKIPLDYELHVPIMVNRKKLSMAIEHNIPWRSAYGNLFMVRGEQISDVKVYTKESDEPGGYDYTSEKYPFLSTDDGSFENVKQNYLMNRFPNPSIYESDSV